MGYTRDDYWQEAFECAMLDEGLDHLLAQMTPEQITNIGGALCGSAENQSLAFYVPENPAMEREAKLKRRLKWTQELETCGTCKGSGRESYMAGPWHCNSQCVTCNGAGKIHPLKEREPTL